MSHSMPSNVPAIVIGAGISGLTCAYALRRAGIDVVLLESADHPGGVIQSIRRDGFLLELGPQSFSLTPPLRQLCQDLGIADQLVSAPPRAPRYVLIDRELQPAPLSPPAFFASPLFGLATKWTLLRDLLGRSAPPTSEESFAAFVRRKFSVELLEKLVGPFVSGIYAGDSEKLSLRAAFLQVYEAEKSAGSVLRGMLRAAKAKSGSRQRPTLASFRDGSPTLIRALAENLGSALKMNVKAVRLRASSSSLPRFAVECENAGGSRTLDSDIVILATPSQPSADLLAELAPAAAAALRQIEYAPVAVVSLGYAASAVRRSLDGFGFLIPRGAGLRTLGTVWNSSLFPARAPRGQVLLTSFVGGATDPAAASLSTEELIALVHREIAPILQISATPVFCNVAHWPRAIPQYNLGHLNRLDAISAALTLHPGLFLTGNYFIGPSLGACIEHAQSIAARIRA